MWNGFNAPTLAQQIDSNKTIILMLIAASGPQEYCQMRRECLIQAYGTPCAVEGAIDALIQEGAIYREWFEPLDEGDEGFYSYTTGPGA